jgi:hypothetical protein
MKIIYKQTIAEKIQNARIEATKNNEIIERIVLDDEEWAEFVKFGKNHFAVWKLGKIINWDDINKVTYDGIWIEKENK